MATKIPFKVRGQREKIAQNYDIEKISFLRNGKPVNLYNYIQEQTEDTDIYKTLEKYGCLDTLELKTEQIFGEFNKCMDLRDVYEQDQEFKNLWNSLPIKVREEFKNDRLLFMKNGENWLKNQLEKERKEQGLETHEEELERLKNEMKQKYLEELKKENLKDKEDE